MGLEFAKEAIASLAPNVPYEVLHSGHVVLTLLTENDAIHAVDNWQNPGGGRPTPAVIAFSEQSLPGLKAAANDLLPIFAKHFSDARLVFTRDRLEVSASFRPLAELNPRDAPRRDYRAIQATPDARSPAAPMRIEQPAALVQPKMPRVMDRRRLALIAVASLAAMIIGGNLLGSFYKSRSALPASKVPVERQSIIPEWAIGLNESSLDGWIAIQKRFDLPDATVRSAIQILRKNDKYSSGQMLHDLAQYPTEVRRAFSLLASQQTGTRFDFGPLENELKARVVAGARFPDEPPGGAYGSLQRESFNNIAVLAIIELFHRRQDDPSVKEILAALRRGRP